MKIHRFIAGLKMMGITNEAILLAAVHGYVTGYLDHKDKDEPQEKDSKCQSL
jgi:hypothetical protein